MLKRNDSIESKADLALSAVCSERSSLAPFTWLLESNRGVDGDARLSRGLMVLTEGRLNPVRSPQIRFSTCSKLERNAAYRPFWHPREGTYLAGLRRIG